MATTEDKEDCCGPSSGSPVDSLLDQEWNLAVEKLYAASVEEKQQVLLQLLHMVSAAAEQEANQADRMPEPSPTDVTLEQLIQALAESVVARADDDPGTSDSDPATEVSTEVSAGGLICDYNSVTDTCIDLGCEIRGGVCVPIAGILKPLFENDCECFLKPGWRDVAIAVILVILIVTPIPGDEALLGPAVIARLLRLVIRGRRLAPVLA
jgi:hypothetical protein